MSRVSGGGEESKGLLMGDNWGKQQEQRCREINVHGMDRGEPEGICLRSECGKRRATASLRVGSDSALGRMI